MACVVFLFRLAFSGCLFTSFGCLRLLLLTRCFPESEARVNPSNAYATVLRRHHHTTSSWKRFRWVGLALTAFYWASLVAAETTRTASVSELDEPLSPPCTGSSIDGTRCVSRVDGTAFSVKWVAQLLNQIFQVPSQAKQSKAQPSKARPSQAKPLFFSAKQRGWR